MLKHSLTVLALCLGTQFALPGDLFAGHLGLFRCRAKTKCCQAACCTAAAPSVPIVASAPVVETIVGDPKRMPYWARAVIYGTGNCPAWGDWVSGPSCADAKANALADARAKAAQQGCIESGYDMDCYPYSCCQQGLLKPITGGCEYRATFKIRCCDGTLVEYSVTHADLAYAKRRARDAACFIAKLNCGGQIRCCWWNICRVPAATPSP